MILEGFKPISSWQIMIDDDDNSVIGIATVAFELYAKAGDWQDGSCNKHNVGMKVYKWLLFEVLQNNKKVTSAWFGKK